MECLRCMYWLVPMLVLPVAVLSGCAHDRAQSSEGGDVLGDAAAAIRELGRAEERASAEQEKEIRDLIEQLVFLESTAGDLFVSAPFITASGASSATDEYRTRFDQCMTSFRKLKEYKALSLPFLVEHLNDKRQSINFRNHVLGHSLGDACYWNIYGQLQDMPSDYSTYGAGRTGRDGKYHEMPYWAGTPFEEAGGIDQWLKANAHLSYIEKQIKCLTWLLDQEKAIGACDSASYFENIWPLEVRILERKQQAGADVAMDLERLRKMKEMNSVAEIPAELLPAR